MSIQFEQIQQLIDELTPIEQVQLLEILTPRIVKYTMRNMVEATTTPSDNAWQQLFNLGNTIATSRTNDSMTNTIHEMRR